jgi:hypothetical protein
MEILDARVRRFSGPPLEVLATLVSSMGLELMPRIRQAVENRTHYGGTLEVTS